MWFCRFYCNYQDVKHFFGCLFLKVKSKSIIDWPSLTVISTLSIVNHMVLMVPLFLLSIDCIWRVFVPPLLYSKTSEDQNWIFCFVYDDRRIIQYKYIRVDVFNPPFFQGRGYELVHCLSENCRCAQAFSAEPTNECYTSPGYLLWHLLTCEWLHMK